MSRPLVIAVSAVLFAAVFALRLTIEGNEEGISLLYSLPVALLAARLGTLAGVAGGVLAIGLYALYVQLEDVDADALSYVTRGTTFLLLGGLLGRYAERLQTVNASLVDARNEADRRSRELARSNADLERYASVASHDLQEPLRMIQTYTEVLAEDLDDRLVGEDRESMRYVLDGTARMRSLIDGLLEFSRVRPEAMMPAPVDLEVAVERALENLEAAVTESGARVEHGDLPTVRADERALQQVFQNLIANAIKFRSDAPPEVFVGARRDGSAWEISVSDNGIGVDPERAERMFALFERLHSKDRYPGAGIGLALCERIIDAHGGRIWAVPNAPRGTTITMTLPDEPPR